MREKMALSDYEVVLIFPEGEQEHILEEMRRCYIQSVLAQWQMELGKGITPPMVTAIFRELEKELSDRG